MPTVRLTEILAALSLATDQSTSAAYPTPEREFVDVELPEGSEVVGECGGLDIVQRRHIGAGLGRLEDGVLVALHGRYGDVIEQGYDENPVLIDVTLGRQPKRSKAQNLLLRLDAREAETLRFASDFRVPFDNNLSERDLRMIKLQQKISGCWRTITGAERFLNVRSYTSTAHKQGQAPLDVLTQLTTGQPWLPTRVSAPAAPG